MKYLPVTIALFVLASILEASVYKSIRVGSFIDKKNAEKSLIKLQKYVDSQEKILKHQKNINFQAKVIKVGKYYMNVIEPFKNEEKELQEVIDNIRLKYSYAYVKKIKTADTKPIVNKKTLPIIKIKKTKDIIKEVEELIEEPVKKEVLINSVEENKTVVDNSKDIEKIIILENNSSRIEDTENISEKDKNITKKIILNETIQTTIEDKKIVEKIIEKAEIEEEPIKKTVYEEQEINNKENIKDAAIEKQKINNDKIVKEKVNHVKSIKKEISKSEIITPNNQQNNFLWQILLAISMGLIVILLKKLYTKNKNEEYIGNDILNLEKTKQSQQTIDYKNKLLFGMSQELRKSLLLILKLTEENNIKEIKNSGKRMLIILDNVLDKQAIENNEFILNEVEFNLKEEFEYLLHQFTVESKSDKIDISLKVQEDIPRLVLGDKNRLNQIMVSIVSNILKFNEHHDIDIAINKISEDDKIINLELSVTDSKIVMNVEEIDTILNNGLIITKELISKMNGSINAKAEKGIGTSIIVSIELEIVKLNTNSELKEESDIITNDMLQDSKIESENPKEVKTSDILVIEAGISRCDNDKEFYYSMLDEFKSMSLNSPLKIEKLCLDNNFEEAQTLVVEIKDFAMNIGAYNLSDSLEIIHYELGKSSKGNWNKLIQFYQIGLENLIKEIDNQIV